MNFLNPSVSGEQGVGRSRQRDSVRDTFFLREVPQVAMEKSAISDLDMRRQNVARQVNGRFVLCGVAGADRLPHFGERFPLGLGQRNLGHRALSPSGLTVQLVWRQIKRPSKTVDTPSVRFSMSGRKALGVPKGFSLRSCSPSE